MGNALTFPQGTARASQRDLPPTGWTPGTFAFSVTLEAVDPGSGQATRLIEATATLRTESTVTPTPGADTPVEAISVVALTTALAARPGQTIDQVFRVHNRSDEAVTVCLVATTSLPLWRATVLQADGTTPIAAPLRLLPHTHRDVVVRVTVPSDAYAGDQNTTTLDAQPVGSSA